MSTVVGVDSSTQSCKVLAVEAETGEVRSSGVAAHPDGTAIDPRVWSTALHEAWDGAGIRSLGTQVIGAGVAAQQHGMVALDDRDRPVFDALLWNDTRSAGQADRMREELGNEAWLEATNLVPVASFTITKLAWLAENKPELAERVARVVLPHDWLNHELTGKYSTDRSEASGTGYFSPLSNRYQPKLLEQYFGRVPELPKVLGSHEAAGSLLAGWGNDAAIVSPGAGDNAAAALGLGLENGEVVVSIGTSGTVFTTSPIPAHDPTGAVAGFADATGNHLPLLATLNAARVMFAGAAMLDVDLQTFDRLARDAAPDAEGLTLLPYLDGERTPNLPNASGTLLGLTRSNMTAGNVARASVLGVLNSLADGLESLRGHGIDVRKVLLIGGGSKSRSLRAAAASIFGVPVEVPAIREYVALGAARQAAWTAHGEFPDWRREIDASYQPEGDWGAEVRARYVAARQRVYGV
ncbi:xylulokinase [Saxibacter everestensis]|uniref:Xylulose kinase n=1 Tax=Saxibacter everestensis TaxID=2909229 RepID=A0ABY8QXB8_9MICO|nr:xylulokinase [Brevibacteriaceae bacterium ZFBP1038]